MNYGIKLKEFRENYGLKQNDLAQILNISRSTYKDYELQIRIIPIKHLNLLCNYFNISLDYIFDLSNKSSYSLEKEKIDNDLFYERFKTFRKENKLSQMKLAELLNTSHSVISDYENKKKLISTPFLYTICKTYNISADYLLGKINSPKNII